MFLFARGNPGKLGRSSILGNTPELPRDDTAKDSATKAAILGIIVPAVIVAAAVFNAFVGRAYWPGGHDGPFIHVYTRFSAVAGTVGFKLGSQASLTPGSGWPTGGGRSTCAIHWRPVG
jgi:hypothetical protein